MPLMIATDSSAQSTEPKTPTRSVVAKFLKAPQGRQILSTNANKKSQPMDRAPSCNIFSIHQFERKAKPALPPQCASIFISAPEKSQATSSGNSPRLINAGSRQKGPLCEPDVTEEVTNMI
jgi:hypothetical protein